MNDLILGLDPSSTVVGYAYKSQYIGTHSFFEAGLVKPDLKRIAEPESFWRIFSICKYIRDLLNERPPTVILIEWTKGKVGRRRHHGQGAGLAVYGCGVGAIANECMHWARQEGCRNGCQVIPILENVWTRGVPKQDRRASIASEYPQYNPETDPGGDIADAIGLIDWWLKEQMIK